MDTQLKKWILPVWISGQNADLWNQTGCDQDRPLEQSQPCLLDTKNWETYEIPERT